MKEQKKSNIESKKIWRGFPSITLKEALRVPSAIQDKNAGKPMQRLLLADALGISPGSTNFRGILSASYKYGLTNGTEKAEYIGLTSLGETITRPTDAVSPLEAMKDAARKPELFGKVYEKYKNAKLPTGDFFYNVLEKEFLIPREFTREASDIFVENAKAANMLKEIQGNLWVLFDLQPGQKDAQNGLEKTSENSISLNQPRLPQAPDVVNISIATANEQRMEESKPIFLGHGKNRKPLDQLAKILTQFKVPHRVAVDEPNSGRPISEKVREVMNSCGSAIIIFAKEDASSVSTPEKPLTEVPNLNAVFELGAASVLYGRKIVIFKEDGLTLPSDFSDLGYIPFEKDKLDAKAMDLIKELLNMELIKISGA